MNLPSIRIARLPDVEQLAVLFDAYRQFYEQPADLTLARRFVSERINHEDSVILVAKSSKAQDLGITGFCQLYPGFCSLLAQPVYTLYDLYVAPTARKTGTGRTLLVAAAAHAAANGFARLDLSTARHNHAAQALYESLGWVRDDVFLHYSITV